MFRRIKWDRSWDFKFWRIFVYTIIVCDDPPNHHYYGYPLWYIKLPWFYKKPGRFGLCSLIILSRSIDIVFFTDKSKLNKLK